MAEFQINIAACRANVGLSQAELAKKLGVSTPTLISWEKGKTEPKISTYKTIGQICGIPFEYIRLGN